VNDVAPRGHYHEPLHLHEAAEREADGVQREMEFEFPFPGSLTSTFLEVAHNLDEAAEREADGVGAVRTTTSQICAVVPRRARI